MRNRQSLNRPNSRAIEALSSRIKITYLPIAQLELNPRNPRFHSPRQIRQIARSIEAFGFNVPVLIDSKRDVIAGHGRIMACRLLGRTEVPTISMQHLSDAKPRRSWWPITS